MKLKLTWLLTLFMAFVMQLSFGQEKDITGTVTAASDGLPLPGVTVLIKGTATGTSTDIDGKYSIKAKAGDILVFSFVSMKTTEKTVGSSSTINVAMADDIASLDEVVITGYSTTTKAKSSVSSVRVSSETIENRPNASFVQTLSGQVPGLNITTSSGQPGGNSLVQLRGVGSITGDTEPLFIIDGAPVDQDNFRSLNPQDILSVDVLKDAGATAIYGNRGANGVIVIKTRQGGFNEGLKINYNGFVAYSSLQDDDYDVLGAQDLLRYERSRGNGAGAGNSNSLFNPGNGTPLTDAQIAAAPNFNWTDFFFRTGVTQSHTVSLSSGGENSSQFTSFGFNDTEGILVQSSLKRFNIRSNITGKSSNGKFNYGTNLTLNYSDSGEPNNIGGGAINRNFVLGALQSVPYLTPEDYTNGAALLAPLSFTNTPLFLLDRVETFTRVDEEVRLIGSANFSYALSDWLTANLLMSGDYQAAQNLRAEGPTSFNALLFGGAENPTSGFQQQNNPRTFAYNQVTSLNASKTYGKHSVDVGLYTEYFKTHFRTFGFFQNGLDPRTFSPGDGSGFIPVALDPASGGIIFNDNPNADIINTGLFSYFASADYDYDERFGGSATIRRDASFRFAASNRWATFWSVSGRWNISNEAFMENSVFNNLKLRASWGTAGNQNIAAPVDATEDFFATGSGYGNANSIFLAQIGNRDLQWETTEQVNIGVDFGVWNNRLRGSLDVYERETSDLFQQTPLSATVGFTSQPANTGLLTNRGFDLQLDYDIIQAKNQGDLRVSVGVVANFNETELDELPNSEGEIIGLGRNGGRLGEYFTLRYAGINPANGELLFLTADGDVTENPNADTDRVWLGKNIIPDWNGSFNLNVDYKNFFFTTQWNYVLGVDRFDNDYAGFINEDNVGQFNFSADILRAWTQPGDITDINSPTATNRNTFASTRFLRDASYLRLRFASFGYNFPSKYLENTGISSARVFINGENLFTFTEWRGFDAETRSNGSREFPTPRTISFGFELGI
ncbi:SusC/RagA family TonB-linked outer membrane protein [Winogradskyella immobilis]|uniref:SusC/RagA family TonB-linked outer membrane protein n=1 Tax=Winogradskyella immobilis TaxID=2816852 RepID=A0ABS8EL41_9FLAO|nr:SusC/RagA family TonB-linked outer membrane protein [Winogradskyella immobilis]MCC1483939.1 SusC/RagA family TonB-linked outer membrane protein [Winogradskyella immobilis]MCG0016032.1 SusC/RagA family TonB-linked outer membrane protein [Winogradskyella immobilis]